MYQDDLTVSDIQIEHAEHLGSVPGRPGHPRKLIEPTFQSFEHENRTPSRQARIPLKRLTTPASSHFSPDYHRLVHDGRALPK